MSDTDHPELVEFEGETLGDTITNMLAEIKFLRELIEMVAYDLEVRPDLLDQNIRQLNHNVKKWQGGMSETKEYVCSWSKSYHDDYRGTMKEILSKFSDLNPDEEEWFAWDYVGLADGARGDYVTGGGVTINEFHADSKVHDRIECENMTIRRVA